MLPGVKTSNCLAQTEGRKVRAARRKALLCAVLRRAVRHRADSIGVLRESWLMAVVAEGPARWGSLVLALSE